MAVAHFAAGYVEPATSIAHGMLKEQLVEIQVLLDVAEHLLSSLHRRDVDVGSLATQVLRYRASTNGMVQSWAAVAAGDANHAEAKSQGFQHLLSQQAKTVDNGAVGRHVIDMLLQSHT